MYLSWELNCRNHVLTTDGRTYEQLRKTKSAAYHAVDLSSEDVETLTKYAASNETQRVCDQTDMVEPRFDIYEESHPENNDKVQAKQG